MSCLRISSNNTNCNSTVDLQLLMDILGNTSNVRSCLPVIAQWLFAVLVWIALINNNFIVLPLLTGPAITAAIFSINQFHMIHVVQCYLTTLACVLLIIIYLIK